MDTRHFIQGFFWLGLYLFVSLLPLFVAFLPPRPPGRDFITEFSVALGFVGLAMLGLQFFLTARFRPVEAPYGLDFILGFHREISIAATGIILAHPALIIWREGSLQLFNLPRQPPRVWFATISTLALLTLVATSLWRQVMRLRYETWRILHGTLAIVALGFALGHVIGVGHYIAHLWQQMVWTLMVAVSVAVLLHVRVFKPLQMKRTPWTVEEIRPQGGDVWTIRCIPEGHDGFDFQAGQFAWLTLAESPYVIEEHPFSFSSSALEQQAVEFTIKELGDFTGDVEETPLGTSAYIDGPYGAFSFERYHAPGYFMIAGGIGITPIMSMLRTMRDYGDTRPVQLIFAAANEANLTFADEISELELEYLETTYVLEDPPEDWDGEVGFVDADIINPRLPEYPLRHQYFLCGPEPMLVNVEKVLIQCGIPHTHIHAERFNLV